MTDIFDSLVEEFRGKLSSVVMAATDPSYWALDSLGIDLYDNQIEIVNDVCNLNIKSLAILQARGSGKTFAVGLALVKLCIDIPSLKVGVFGPKAEQASRIIKVITEEIVSPSSKVFGSINWKKSTNSRLVFNNGSEVLAISAAESTMQEGYHFNIVVLDECHRISDLSVNQRIIPMLGSLPIGKIIKLGISMYRQNFWKSCCAPNTPYKVLVRDYTKCPILLREGSIMYNGVEYSEYVLKQMPLSFKVKLFPDRPDLHYDGSMTEVDFSTQYLMLWSQDIALFLNEEHQKALVSGVHDILLGQRRELQEMYFFGLDTAGGTLGKDKKDLDFTALSIWRKMADNTKQKVRCFEWQGNIIQQIDEIKSIIHPKTGLFPCMFGLADYSNIAINVVESFKEEQIPIEGIMFNQTETTTHKNMKNAMFDQFLFELEQGRIQYPDLKSFETEVHSKDCRCAVVFKKAFNEWCNLERHVKTGINHDIKAPADFHDDHPCADVLACWAMDRYMNFKNVGHGIVKLPTPQVGPSHLAGRGIPFPATNETKKYLK